MVPTLVENSKLFRVLVYFKCGHSIIVLYKGYKLTGFQCTTTFTGQIIICQIGLI